jgi:hypothetical protein
MGEWMDGLTDLDRGDDEKGGSIKKSLELYTLSAPSGWRKGKSRIGGLQSDHEEEMAFEQASIYAFALERQIKINPAERVTVSISTRSLDFVAVHDMIERLMFRAAVD